MLSLKAKLPVIIGIGLWHIPTGGYVLVAASAAIAMPKDIHTKITMGYKYASLADAAQYLTFGLWRTYQCFTHKVKSQAEMCEIGIKETIDGIGAALDGMITAWISNKIYDNVENKLGWGDVVNVMQYFVGENAANPIDHDY